MRLVFIATGEIALPAFRHLLTNGPLPLALVTQPDKPVGRHQTFTPPLIRTEAIAAGIPVLQPDKIGDIAGQLTELRPDVIVVMAYGQILRKNILRIAGKAIINLHASILPRFRGAACIQAAIDAGDTETGITAMHMVRELDAGDVILTRKIPIAADETGGSLHDKLAGLAPAVLAETLELLESATAPRVPQDLSRVSHVPKLGRDDGRIDWTKPAIELERRIRAYDPWPGTFTMIDGKRVKIFPPTAVADEALRPGDAVVAGGRLVVGCGSKALQIETLQPDGSRKMSAAEYLRGRQPQRFA